MFNHRHTEYARLCNYQLSSPYTFLTCYFYDGDQQLYTSWMAKSCSMLHSLSEKTTKTCNVTVFIPNTESNTVTYILL